MSNEESPWSNFTFHEAAYFTQVKHYNNAKGISKTMSLNTPYFGDFTIDDCQNAQAQDIPFKMLGCVLRHIGLA